MNSESDRRNVTGASTGLGAIINLVLVPVGQFDFPGAFR